ncbi:hypothetical protein CBS101457_003900 [Exobasidium rhododendri]|nr:hypothetical protein CBS101457_003900 [Exobasidium rhododendri]
MSTFLEKKGQKNGYGGSEEINTLDANVEQNMLRIPSGPDLASQEELTRLEKKLVRKIDLRLMPVVVLLYVLNYLDRNSISAARLAGLEQDLKLTDTQYQTCLSILYVGYITLQIPSNLALAYIGRPRIYLPICVAVWGVVSGLSAICDTFVHLLLVRFFLGIVEAAFFPGALYLLSRWYTRKEIPTRMALLYGGSILSNAISGLIAAGILGGMEGTAGIRGWKWLFIIEGSITVFVALCAIFILPDFPHNTNILTEDERKLAVNRLSRDQGQTEVEGAQGERPIDGIYQAASDPVIWLFVLCLTSCTIGVAFNQFFPTLVGTLGYDKIQTLLITFGPWGWAFLVVMANALHANKTGERTLHLCIPLAIGIIGFIISASTQNLGARFFALFIEAQSYAGYVIILSWLSNSIRGTYKRAVGLALVNCLSQLGNISGSYVWPAKWGPSYWRSNTISACCFLVTIASAIVIRQVLLRRNKELDLKYGADTQEESHVAHPDVILEEGADKQDDNLRQSLDARVKYRYIV